MLISTSNDAFCGRCTVPKTPLTCTSIASNVVHVYLLTDWGVVRVCESRFVVVSGKLQHMSKNEK